MPWFSVCDRLAEHKKSDALEKVCDGDDARLAMAWMTWVHMGADCMARLTDGRFETRRALRVVRLGPENVTRALSDLTAAGFLDAHDDGHEFHEWLHYQRSADQIKRERESNRDRKSRQRAGHAVTPPVTASVKPAVSTASGHDGSHRPPSPPLPEEITSSEPSRFHTTTVSREAVTPAVSHGVTQNDGTAPPSFAEVCEIVRRESDNAATWHRGATHHQAQLRREVEVWRYPAEVWAEFGKAIATREGREALWPWAKSRVAAGVDLRFLVGTTITDADGKAVGGDWGPLTEALRRVTHPEAFAGTDGPSSGHGGAFPGDPEGNSKVWATKTQAERQAAYERFQPCWRAGITSPRSHGWDRFTPEQIDAYARQLEAQRAVEAERGPALRKAVG